MTASASDVPVGVRYCTAHNGIADVDQTTCDFSAGEPTVCELHDLFMRSVEEVVAEGKRIAQEVLDR